MKHTFSQWNPDSTRIWLNATRFTRYLWMIRWMSSRFFIQETSSLTRQTTAPSITIVTPTHMAHTHSQLAAMIRQKKMLDWVNIVQSAPGINLFLLQKPTSFSRYYEGFPPSLPPRPNASSCGDGNEKDQLPLSNCEAEVNFQTKDSLVPTGWGKKKHIYTGMQPVSCRWCTQIKN